MATTDRARVPVAANLFGYNRFGNANLTHAALGFASTGMFLPLVIYLQVRSRECAGRL